MADNFRELLLKNFFKISFAFIIVIFFVYLMVPFLISILLGGILAMALDPLVELLCRRGLKRGTSLVILSVTLFIAGLAPAIVFFIRGSKIITDILQEEGLKDLSQRLSTAAYGVINKLSGVYGVDPEFARMKFETVLASMGNFLMKLFSGFIAELPTILLVGIITNLSMYCFLKESDKIREFFDRYFHFSPSNGDKFIRTVKVSCREVFLSNMLTGVLQALIVSLGSLFFGVGDFFLVFFITFVVSFIPIIGAGPVAFVLALLIFSEGRTGEGIGMIVIAVITGLSDNILRSYMAYKGEVEVHPFVAFLAVIGGVIMLGLPGLFVGPLVASLIVGAVPIVFQEYFPENEK